MVKDFIKIIVRYFPFRIIWRKYLIRTRFRNEVQLLKDRHKSTGSVQSVLFFTTEKCASVYLTSVFRGILADSNISFINLEGYNVTVGKPVTLLNKGIYRLERLNHEVFKPEGYFYGPLRRYYSELPNLDNYKIILILRDPRDVLTSLYFSKAYSHSIPYYNPVIANRILEYRSKTLTQSIDEFVLNECQEWVDRYDIYCQKLMNRPNVFFTTYEQMINDFNTWLTSVVRFMGISTKLESTIEKFKHENFKVDREDIFSNKRQVSPGDHINKLKTETVNILNDNFQQILKMLDFPCE